MKSVCIFSTCLALLLEATSAKHGADADAVSSATAMLRSQRSAANLQVVERLVARQMRGHPKELMKEEQLLHRAGQMADKTLRRLSLLREEEQATKAKMSEVFATKQGVEVDAEASASERAERIAVDIRSVEHLVAKEMRGHPQELMEEEHLLHKAGRMADSGAESMQHVIFLHEEEQATQAKMREAMARATHLASERTTMTRGAAQAESGSEQLASIASTEQALLRNGQQEMDAAQDVKSEVVEAVGESDPRKAAKVEKLMDEVRGKESSILKSVADEAKLTQHLAAEEKMGRHRPQTIVTAARHGRHHEHLVTEKMGRRRPQKVAAARHDRQLLEESHHKRGEAGFLARSTVELARFTLAEEHAAAHDRDTLHLMQQLTDKGELALGKNPQTAEKFSKLMAMAQRDQRNIAQREMAEALHERRLLRSSAHKHHRHRGRHGHHGEHQLWTHHRHRHAKRRAHDTERVLAGLHEAEAVVGWELAGTEAGKEVHALLEEAKEEEEKVVHLARKSSRITREVQETLQEKMK